MRTRILAAAATMMMAMGLCAAAPSQASAQATVSVSLTILPMVESHESPVRVRMAAEGLRADHTEQESSSAMLLSVEVVEERRAPAGPVTVIQLIAANS